MAVATFRGGQNLNFAIPSHYVVVLLKQARKLSAFSSVGAKREVKSVVGELGGKSTEGVIGSNLTCKPDLEYIRPNNWECSFSLVNKLRSPVRQAQYLVILWSKNGEPLDTKEGRYGGVIRPGLAVRPTTSGNHSFTVPHEVKLITSKMEIRVLGFAIDE